MWDLTCNDLDLSQILDDTCESTHRVRRILDAIYDSLEWLAQQFKKDPAHTDSDRADPESYCAGLRSDPTDPERQSAALARRASAS